MYRLIASDMDDTFLGTGGVLPQANIDALRALREMGILFVPSSGRPYPSLVSSLAKIADLLEGSYVISYNGGCINRFGDATPLVSTTMDFQRVSDLFCWAKERGIGTHVYQLDGRVWVSDMDDDDRAYVGGRMDVTEFDDPDINFLADAPMAKILFVNSDFDRLHALAREVPAELTDGLAVTFSSGRYLEFNPAGVNKGAGLTRLCEYLGIPLADTIACGDAANDREMLAAAGVGVTVANATSEVADVADYRASATCDDGVLAEVLENLVRAQP